MFANDSVVEAFFEKIFEMSAASGNVPSYLHEKFHEFCSFGSTLYTNTVYIQIWKIFHGAT